jgi:hypothetical protein
MAYSDFGITISEGAVGYNFADGDGCCSETRGHRAAALRELSSWTVAQNVSLCCCASGALELRVGSDVWRLAISGDDTEELDAALRRNAELDAEGSRSSKERAQAGAGAGSKDFSETTTRGCCCDEATTRIAFGPGDALHVHESLSAYAGCVTRKVLTHGFMSRLDFADVREVSSCCSKRTEAAIGLGGAAPGAVAYAAFQDANAQGLLREFERRCFHPAIVPVDLLVVVGRIDGGCCSSSDTGGQAPQLIVRNTSISLVDRSGSSCCKDERRLYWLPLSGVSQVLTAESGCCSSSGTIVIKAAAAAAPDIEFPTIVSDSRAQAEVIVQLIRSATARNDAAIFSSSAASGADKNSAVAASANGSEERMDELKPRVSALRSPSHASTPLLAASQGKM